jgi:hypothetical protein
MFILRRLSLCDVGAAPKRRDLGLAVRISHNLGSNAVNAACLQLSRSVSAIRKLVGRDS